MKPAVLGIVRHLLTLAAGALVSGGSLDPAQAETVIGALLAIIGVGLSVYDKRA